MLNYFRKSTIIKLLNTAYTGRTVVFDKNSGLGVLIVNDAVIIVYGIGNEIYDLYVAEFTIDEPINDIRSTFDVRLLGTYYRDDNRVDIATRSGTINARNLNDVANAIGRASINTHDKLWRYL